MEAKGQMTLDGCTKANKHGIKPKFTQSCTKCAKANNHKKTEINNVAVKPWKEEFMWNINHTGTTMRYLLQN